MTLRYLGEDGYPFLNGVPARDLNESDLERLAFVRGVAIKALVTELTATGIYITEEPATPAQPEAQDV